MKLLSLIPIAIFAISSTSLAQNIEDTDLSRYQVVEEGQSTIDLSELERMEEEYTSTLQNDGCGVALPLIVSFSDSANRVANILRQGNEPYYDARRDDQQTIARNRTLLNELVTAESASNELIYARNRAWVEEARCLIEEGDQNAAIIRLYRALDYITHNELELWHEARTLLWQQVGFAP